MSDTKYSISGQVARISPVETRGKYSTRKLVLDTTTNPKWPNIIELECFGDKGIALVADVGEGDEATVEFYVKGREWTAKDGTVKVFTTLSAQAVTVTKAAPRRAPVADGGGWGDPPSADPYDPNNPDNQLPF